MIDLTVMSIGVMARRPCGHNDTYMRASYVTRIGNRSNALLLAIHCLCGLKLLPNAAHESVQQSRQARNHIYGSFKILRRSVRPPCFMSL